MYEVEHLSVGKKAPDIKGKDIDGQNLKLSDYRGRVVVVDFFSDRIENVSELYQHHQAIVRRYSRDPFQLLGVNIDPLEQARTAINLQKVIWPCLWDGPDGPIAKRWNI